MLLRLIVGTKKIDTLKDYLTNIKNLIYKKRSTTFEFNVIDKSQYSKAP